MLKFVSRPFHTLGPRLAAQLLDMPAMSPTMTEGGIVSWAVEPGASFSAGDVLLDIETDKAQISVEAQDDGVLAQILKENGASGIQVGTPIAVLCDPEDDIKSIDLESLINSKAESAPKTEEPEEVKQNEPPREKKEVHLDQVWLPSVIRLAHTFGIDPKDVKGTGPNNRVLKGDVLAALDQIPKSAPSEISKAISKLQHLDLSYEAAPTKEAPKKQEKPKPIILEVDISLEPLVENNMLIERAILKAQRLAIRDSIIASKPRPSALRSPTLDLLAAPKNKVPYSYELTLLKSRGQPFLIHAAAEYLGKDAEAKANVFIDRVQYYLGDGVKELLV